MVRTIYRQVSPVEVPQLDRVVEQLREPFPQVAELLANAAPDILAFAPFPVAHWQKLWSNNPQERLNPHNRRLRLRRRHDGGPRILHLRHGDCQPRSRRARHLRRGVMSIIASNASCRAAYIVLLLLPGFFSAKKRAGIVKCRLVSRFPVIPTQAPNHHVRNPPSSQGGRRSAKPRGQMETHAGSSLPTSAADVKPQQRDELFARFDQFCQDHDLPGGSYPIRASALKPFCASMGIGRKSRKARKQRRVIKDILSRPVRLYAGAEPMAGPPKGPPDHKGRRQYYSLDACRRGGIRSGAVRRHKVRNRNTSIREMVFARGYTRQQAAVHHGVSLRTVYYVLSHTSFSRAAKRTHNHGFAQHATNNLGQAAQCAGCRDVVPLPAAPVFARPVVALKLFWRRAARALLKSAPDRRWEAIHKRTINQLSREIAQYKAAIARHDPDRAERVIKASKAWLDSLFTTFEDPLPILIRHQQRSMSRRP